LSNFRLDDRSQDAEMLIQLPADVRCAEAAVHVTSENRLGELRFSAVLLPLVWPPVTTTGPYFSFACVIAGVT